MEAYVSGTAGMAAIIQGLNAELYYADKRDYLCITSQAAKQIFSAKDDTIILRDSEKKEVLNKLAKETNKSTSLMLLLTILDTETDNSSKIMLAKYLEELFTKDVNAYDYVCNIIFTRPLPSDEFKLFPKSLISETNKTYSLINLILECQSKIKESHSVFDSLCNKYGLEEKLVSLIEGKLVNASFFYTIASNQACDKFLNKIHFMLLSDLKSTGMSDLINFTSSFKTQFKPFIHNVKERLVKVDHFDSHDIQSEKSKYEHKVKKPSNSEAFENARTQLKSIKNKLRSKHITSAKKMARELINSQVSNGSSQFAAQSLCQLSEFAKNLKFYDLQLEWALEAAKVAPLDYRTYGHVADSYINLEDYIGAQKYFELCLKADDDNRIYGLTGLARIERSRYNLSAALIHADQAIEECGKDFVPYLIKAELLRDQHRYSESEEIYNIVCKNFPEEVIPHCGKAAVLADQKQFEDAEKTYKFALNNYSKPEEQCKILSGLGFLVARLGRFAESYKFLDESIALASYEDIVPLASKATVLQMEGRFKESEKLLLSMSNRTSLYSAVVEQLLSLYLKTHELKKAETLYNNAPTSIKNSETVQIRYSQLLKQQNKFDLALEVIDKLRSSKPMYTTAMNARASIFKEMGQFKSALIQYKEVLKVNKYDRTASFGIESVSFILDGQSEIINPIDAVENDSLITIEDYQSVGNLALLKLARGEAKAAKILLQKVCNSNFSSLNYNYSPALSLASLMLNQKAAALKAIKKPMNIIAYVQKALVLGEQGNKMQLLNSLNKLDDYLPDFSLKILEMIKDKYLKAANDEYISSDEIYQEQLKNMLIAA
jgi:tetratricopeptide (TPR) repeat protein